MQGNADNLVCLAAGRSGRNTEPGVDLAMCQRELNDGIIALSDSANGKDLQAYQTLVGVNRDATTCRPFYCGMQV